MSNPLSLDLRERHLLVRARPWCGEREGKPHGGDRHSDRMEAQADPTRYWWQGGASSR